MESLRYLVSQNVLQVRESVRSLSLELSQQESRSLDELSTWFAKKVSQELGLQQTWIWLDEKVLGTTSIAPLVADDLRNLQQYLTEQNLSNVDRESLPEPRLRSILQDLEIAYVFLCQFRACKDWYFLATIQKRSFQWRTTSLIVDFV